MTAINQGFKSCTCLIESREEPQVLGYIRLDTKGQNSLLPTQPFGDSKTNQPIDISDHIVPHKLVASWCLIALLIIN